jgi:acyl-CoA thioesterase-1
MRFLKFTGLLLLASVTLSCRENSGTKETVINSEKKVEMRIINAFGDSLTAGYGLPLENSYPSVLEKKLQAAGYNYKVINSGLSGDTTAGALSRVKWVLASKPEIVILSLGANDALRGLPVNEARKNLAQMIEQFQKAGIKILLCGMLAPRNMGEKYYKEFDAIYPDLAKKYQLTLVPFFLDKVALNRALNIGDGIHPNEKGYRYIVDNNIWPNLLSLLKK